MNAKEKHVWDALLTALRNKGFNDTADTAERHMAEAGKTHTPEQVQRILQAGVDNTSFKGRGKKK